MPKPSFPCLVDPDRACNGIRLARHVQPVDAADGVLVDCEEPDCSVKSLLVRLLHLDGDADVVVLVPCRLLAIIKDQAARISALEARAAADEAAEDEARAAWAGALRGRGPMGG